MKNLKLGSVGVLLLLAFGSLHAAEPAGNILVLQGSATATREGKDVPLQRGSAVESGDIIKVGDTSSLQIRFSDESIVALRANTVFGVENFKYSTQDKSGSSIFNLVKGGIRTITGLIGKSNPDNFAIKNQNATIGIRGTHFILVSCLGDCFNADGSLAQDGLFGSVIDGRIVARTSVGESEFGKNQFFLALPNLLPQPLLAPPSFLRDKLDGQARAKGTTQTAQSSSGSGEKSDLTSPTMSTSQSVLSSSTGLSSALLTTESTFVPSSTTGVQSAAGLAVGGGFSWSEASLGLENYSGYSPLSGAFSGISGYADGYQFEGLPMLLVDEEGMTAPFSAATIVDVYKTAYSGPMSYTDTYNGVTYTGTYTKSASVDVGTSSAGNVTWGRYSESGSETGSDGSNETWSGVYHWAVGDPVTSPPTSGVFTYVPVGGTSPTDYMGNVGSVSSRGSWTVDFGSKTIGTATPMAWSMPDGSNYTVAVPVQGFTIEQYSMPGGGVYKSVFSGSGGYLTTSASCGGTCSSVTNSSVGVTGYGAQAEGMGAAVTASGMVSSVEKTSGMVNVYKR
jgi:hypothetical protein